MPVKRGIGVLSEECLTKALIWAVQDICSYVAKDDSDEADHACGGSHPCTLARVDRAWSVAMKNAEPWRLSEYTGVLQCYASVAKARDDKYSLDRNSVLEHEEGIMSRHRWNEVFELMKRVEFLPPILDNDHAGKLWEGTTEAARYMIEHASLGLHQVDIKLFRFRVSRLPDQDASKEDSLEFYLLATHELDQTNALEEKWDSSQMSLYRHSNDNTLCPLFTIAHSNKIQPTAHAPQATHRDLFECSMASDRVINEITSELGLPTAWSQQEVVQLLASIAWFHHDVSILHPSAPAWNGDRMLDMEERDMLTPWTKKSCLWTADWQGYSNAKLLKELTTEFTEITVSVKTFMFNEDTRIRINQFDDWFETMLRTPGRVPGRLWSWMRPKWRTALGMPPWVPEGPQSDGKAPPAANPSVTLTNNRARAERPGR